MESLGAETGVVRLSGPLTIRYISALHEILTKSIDAGDLITLELPADSEADICFVQLVVAARVSARAAGKQINLTRPAEGPLLDVLTRGGFIEGDEAGFWTGRGRLQ